MTKIALLLSACLLAGCASHDPIVAQDLNPGRLPPPDRSLSIAGLGPCTDSPDRSLHLKAGEPATVLVHGCFGSSGQFRALAQVLAFQGQQSACFTYDDRASELRRAATLLAGQAGSPPVTLIGHSQGALIARRALTDALDPAPSLPTTEAVDWRLVTISGPFSGIGAASTCGKSWLYPFTLGLLLQVLQVLQHFHRSQVERHYVFVRLHHRSRTAAGRGQLPED
jgi:pimeloyl-ACP methyl ester carboxylesterase